MQVKAIRIDNDNDALSLLTLSLLNDYGYRKKTQKCDSACIALNALIFNDYASISMIQ